MRLFVKSSAPSAVRVQIFIDEVGPAEKIEMVEVTDTAAADFLRMNPFGSVPVLETRGGEFISESLTICRYLDEIWVSGLVGRSLEERSRVEMWERRAELQLFLPAIEYVHQIHPSLCDRATQNAQWAHVIAERARTSMLLFQRRLEMSAFVGSDIFSIADITAFLAISTLAALRTIDLGSLPAVRQWADRVGERPSMKRLDQLAI